MDPHPHQPGNSKRSPPPPATEPRQDPKKHKKLRMSGRNQRMAPTDRMGGDDMKKGFDGPHYRVTDQDWKMCKSPLHGNPHRVVSPRVIARANILASRLP